MNVDGIQSGYGLTIRPSDYCRFGIREQGYGGRRPAENMIICIGNTIDNLYEPMIVVYPELQMLYSTFSLCFVFVFVIVDAY